MKEGKPIFRNAAFRDLDAIYHLIKSYPDELLARPVSDIAQNIDRFLVCELDGKVVGTVSWSILPEIGMAKHPAVEIKSVAVKKNSRHRGIGTQLVKAALRRVKVLHPSQVIVLTFAPDFFARLGFQRAAKEKLMHKLYMGCINCAKYDSPFTCPEVAMCLNFEKAPDDAV